MGRLYAAFDVHQDDPSTSRRGFKPDEMSDRRMIAAMNGRPSVLCAWCGNRVRLDAARLQEGGWKSQDYYICSACKKYGDPRQRIDPDAKPVKCTRCASEYVYQAYFTDHTDGAVLCQHCAGLTGGHHQMSLLTTGADKEWYRVLPLHAEHECGVCHEHGPCVERYDIVPWLLKTGVTTVCIECNKIASEV